MHPHPHGIVAFFVQAGLGETRRRTVTGLRVAHRRTDWVTGGSSEDCDWVRGGSLEDCNLLLVAFLFGRQTDLKSKK